MCSVVTPLPWLGSRSGPSDARVGMHAHACVYVRAGTYEEFSKCSDAILATACSAHVHTHARTHTIVF
jgi:hypothetical protein